MRGGGARNYLPERNYTQIAARNPSARIAPDKAGHAPTTAFLNHACPLAHASAQANYATCATNLAARFHELVIYQPESRFWTFQWYETAIFLGLTAVLAGICFLWIRRPS